MKRISLKRSVVVASIGLCCRLGQAQESPEPWVPRVVAPQYFAVLVEDLDEAVRWYRAAFDLEEQDDSTADDGAWRVVNLSNDQLFVELIRDDRASAVERGRGFFKVGFGVPDVDVVADRVARAGRERPRTLDDERHGIRILQLRDPEGNVIQLSSKLERPASRKEPKGARR